jgi:cell division protein FtsL
MFPLDAPPDTSVYMIAGYTIFFIIAAIYIVSLLVRWHNLHQDMTTLEAIEKENQSKKEKPVKIEKTKTKIAKTAKKKSKS